MTTQSVAGRLDKHFGKPLGQLSPELKEIADAYIPKWSELSAIERKAKAQEVDRQRDVKERIRIGQFARSNETEPQRVRLPDGGAMTKKVVFWLAPNENRIPADQIPGAIAETLNPPPERDELAGHALNGLNVEQRLKEEREQAKKLRIKFPHLKDGDTFLIGDLNDYLARQEMVAEIRHRSDVIDNLDPKSRWNNRLLIEGFKSVQDPVLNAKYFRAEVSIERCIELSNERQLHVDNWIELVGVGIGQRYLYDISSDCVKFRAHEEEYISQCPPEWQADMMRDNRVAPRLDFPCTPIEMLNFVDTLAGFCDSAIGMHSFMLPEAFRRAVETSTQSGTPKSDAPSANTPVKKQLINGVGRNEIIAAFPPPIGVTPEQWSKRLGDPSKAMKVARVFSGSGGVSALWNPAKFAMWYAEKNYSARQNITVIMRREFPDYLPEWETFTASFD